MTDRAVAHNAYWQAFEEQGHLLESEVAALLEPSGPFEIGAGASGVPHRTVSYRELLKSTAALSDALMTRGLSAGDRVLLLAPPSVALYQALMATLRCGAVCLFVDPADGLIHMDAVAARLAPKMFIGSPKAMRLRFLCPAIARIPVALSTQSGWLQPDTLDEILTTGDPTRPTQPVAADDAAVISFTSGSTGSPKGVRRSHRELRAQFHLASRHEGKRLTGVNLCAFPILPIDDLSAGRTSLLAHFRPGRPAQADPSTLLDQVQQFPPTLISCPPVILERLLTLARTRSIRLESVRHVYTGGGDVPLSVLRAATTVLQQASVHMLYGSQEAEPVAMIDGDELLTQTAVDTALGRGRCVGRLAPETRVRIVRPAEGPLQSLEDVSGTGEVLVAGPHVNRTYFENPEATRLQKFVEEGTGTVWHRMGDLGWIDPQARLWIVGRPSQVVHASTGDLHPGQVEPQLDEIEGVRKSALVAIPVVTGGAPRSAAVAMIELEPGADGTAVMANAQRRAQERQLPLEAIQVVDHIPYDARIGAKIQYARLVHRFGPLIRARLSDPFSTRLAAYLSQRFPPKDTLVGAFVLTLALSIAAGGAGWGSMVRVTATTLAVFLFFFHLRVFDEQKDLSIDRVLHPDRALSRGLVSLDELTTLGFHAMVLEGVLALLLGWPALKTWAVAFGYSVLMRREFFCREFLRDNILFYGISHVTVVFLLAQFIVAGTSGTASLVVLPACIATGIAWFNEIARKLDPPDEVRVVNGVSEESYVGSLGLNGTVALLVILQLGLLALGLVVARARGAGGITHGALIGMALLGLGSTATFGRRPSKTAGKKLHKVSLLWALVQYTTWIVRPFWGGVP